MEGHSISLAKRVLQLYSVEAEHPVGTCFGLGRPGLFLTAAHALDGIPPNAIRVVSVGPVVNTWAVSEIRRHGMCVARTYSPVVRDWARQEVIGVATESIRYSTELGEDRTEAHWTIAASLAPVGDWLDSL